MVWCAIFVWISSGRDCLGESRNYGAQKSRSHYPGGETAGLVQTVREKTRRDDPVKRRKANFTTVWKEMGNSK